ncbi:MAG TPA: hypothetical protein VGI11_12590, partial [Variovorax sp.]
MQQAMWRAWVKGRWNEEERSAEDYPLRARLFQKCAAATVRTKQKGAPRGACLRAARAVQFAAGAGAMVPCFLAAALALRVAIFAWP